EGTGSKPGVPDVPSDDSKEELSWNYSDDEDVGGHEEGNESDESDDERESEEEEETRQEEEESFDPIPRTPEESEEESNDDEDQDLRLSEEARIQEEEDADELYRDVNINQGRGLQVTQNVEDTPVTLTPVNPDGVESIFTTASSPIVSLQPQTPIMTSSTIATITTSGEAPIPSTTIPSIILENLPTFNSAFRFEERLRSLETSFSEYRQTNPFADAVSAIPGIVQQYMTQQMTEAPRRPPSPDRAWNTTLPAAQGNAQSWISNLARQTDARSSFNELLDTPIDFSRRRT
nr:hypothetical protein [Tanacetum cinerariifolium]